jgi:hypothetical protein
MKRANALNEWNSNSTVVLERVGCGQAGGLGQTRFIYQLRAQLATSNGPGAIDQRGQTFVRLVTPAGATAIREHGSSGASARHGDEHGRRLQGNGPLSELPVAAATCRSPRQKACVCPRRLAIRHTASAAVSRAARALRSRARAWCLCELAFAAPDWERRRKRGLHDWAFATTMDSDGLPRAVPQEHGASILTQREMTAAERTCRARPTPPGSFC